MTRKTLALASITLLIFVSLILAAPVTHAINIVSNSTITVEAGEIVNDDLYAFGGIVRIDGTVNGDLYALAKEVVIGPTGRVTGDLVVAGQIIDIQGQVDDDVRVAGQVIRFSGPNVGDDVLATGFSIEQTATNHIHGTFIAGAYQVLLAGEIDEDAIAGTNGLEIAGHINGNVRASVGERSDSSRAVFMPFFGAPGIEMPHVPLGLTVDEGAVIEGDLTYQALEEAHVAPGAEIHGQVIHKLPAPREATSEERVTFGSFQWALQQARRLVSYLLIGIILFLVAPAASRQVGSAVRRNPIPALGWGIVGILVTLAALFIIVLSAVLFMLVWGLISLDFLAKWTIILGLGLDAFIILGYLAYTNLLVPILVPYGALSKVDRGGYWWVLPLVVGVIVYVVVTALPYVGWLFSLLAVLIGVGALIVVWRERRMSLPT